MHHTGRGGVAHRTGRASLRSGLRPRFQHHRGVRRPHPQEARRRRDPDRARPRLSAHAARDRMRANSLALRLFLSATPWTVIILFVTGFVLSSLYRQAVERSFDRRLGVYLRTLVAEVAAPEEASDRVAAIARRAAVRPAAVGLVLAGHAAAAPKPEIRSSRSLWDGGLPRLLDEYRGARRGRHPPRLCRWTGRSAASPGRTRRRSRRGRPFSGGGRRRSAEIDDETRNFDRALMVDLRHAARRAVPHHHVPGPVRPCAAQADIRVARRHPRRHRRAAGGALPGRDRAARARNQCADRSQPRDRRARAHARRQSRACAEDAALGDGQRGRRAAGRSAGQQGLEQTDIMRDQVARHLERARLAARA